MAGPDGAVGLGWQPQPAGLLAITYYAGDDTHTDLFTPQGEFRHHLDEFDIRPANSDAWFDNGRFLAGERPMMGLGSAVFDLTTGEISALTYQPSPYRGTVGQLADGRVVWRRGNGEGQDPTFTYLLSSPDWSTSQVWFTATHASGFAGVRRAASRSPNNNRRTLLRGGKAVLYTV